MSPDHATVAQDLGKRPNELDVPPDSYVITTERIDFSGRDQPYVPTNELPCPSQEVLSGCCLTNEPRMFSDGTISADILSRNGMPIDKLATGGTKTAAPMSASMPTANVSPAENSRQSTDRK